MWTIAGRDIKQDFGMDFLNNQIHKLLISTKADFDINSEFEETNYEQWWRVYPYGLCYSENETASIDVIFKRENAMLYDMQDFKYWMTSNDFKKTLANVDYGIETDIILKGISNITEYNNSVTCTLDLYVSNKYEGVYDSGMLTNKTTSLWLNFRYGDIGRFGIISLKGNYKELSDIHKLRMNTIAKDLTGVNYPVLGLDKKEASLKFVIASDSILSVMELFKNFIYYCKLPSGNKIPDTDIHELIHWEISDKMPTISQYGFFTQFIPTYLNYNNGKAWLEFTATFRIAELDPPEIQPMQ